MNKLFNRWAFTVVSLLLMTFYYLLIPGCGGGEDIKANDESNSKSVGSIRGTVAPAAANAEVRLFRNGQQIATTKSDANGNYVFADVEPGTYEIIAVADGYKSLSPEAVAVIVGQTVTKNFALERLVTKLTGVVVAPNGSWIEGAIVTAKSKAGEKIQETDRFGVFTFEEIWADVEITVTIQAEGMEEQTLKVDAIRRGETVKRQIDMVARPEGPKEGTVGSKVGDKAPDFSLSDINGNPITLSDYRGKKIILLNFNRGQF